MRLAVRLQIGQVHVVVAVGQQRVADRLEDARLVAAEVLREDQVQRRAGLRLVLIVPVRAVPAPAVGDLLGGQTEQEEVLLPASSAISIVAPSSVPMVSAPFIMNFMLLVPLAS